MTNIWPLWIIPADIRGSHNCYSLQLLNIYFNPATLHLQAMSHFIKPTLSVIQSSINQHSKLGVNEKLMEAWHRQPHHTDNTTSKARTSQNTRAAWQQGLLLLQELIKSQIDLFESLLPILLRTDTHEPTVPDHWKDKWWAGHWDRLGPGREAGHSVTEWKGGEGSGWRCGH